MTSQKKKMSRQLLRSSIALVIAMGVTVATTFAWYIYNTGAHTTDVEMVAGSSASLYISKEENGEYTSSISFDSTPFSSNSRMLLPVSTIDLTKGKDGFSRMDATRTNNGPGQPISVAYKFKAAAGTEYYQEVLYLKTMNSNMNVYVKKIGFSSEKEDPNIPLSTALRMGLVVSGGGNATEQYIFALDSDNHIQGAEINTATGSDAPVLTSDNYAIDSVTGKPVPFTPYTEKNFCSYNEDTGEVSISSDTVSIAKCSAGSAVRVDVYVWLEGCDQDCTTAVVGKTLENISIEFAGSGT